MPFAPNFAPSSSLSIPMGHFYLRGNICAREEAQQEVTKTFQIFAIAPPLLPAMSPDFNGVSFEGRQEHSWKSGNGNWAGPKHETYL